MQNTALTSVAASILIVCFTNAVLFLSLCKRFLDCRVSTEWHHGSPAALLESPLQIWPRVSVMLCLFEPAWPDPQVRCEHVPLVLEAVCERHQFQVGLSYVWISLQ